MKLDIRRQGCDNSCLLSVVSREAVLLQHHEDAPSYASTADEELYKMEDDLMSYDYIFDTAPDVGDAEYAEYYGDEVYEMSSKMTDWNDEEFPGYSFSDVCRYCAKPTLIDSVLFLYNIALWSFLINISVKSGKIPVFLVHMLSSCSGAYIMWGMFGSRITYVVGLVTVGVTVLCTAFFFMKKHRGPITCAACVVYVAACEILLADPMDWHSIRGTQMIMLMKLVSLGYDFDQDILKSFPNPLELSGYLLLPSTLIFGPWISVSTYRKLFLSHQKIFPTVLKILWSFTLSLAFLLSSTCFIGWLIPDASFLWLRLYRDAFSFRSSHYFVSYFSEAALLISGIDNISVAKAFHVEVPRSLVQVTVFWNIPMHNWFKKNVFQPVRQISGTAVAIAATYLISTLVHGLNFKLGAVLLSLAFFTFVEHKFRSVLADAFHACIMAKPCKTCHHCHKGDHWFSIMVNITFGILALIHLTYLGMLMDTSAEEEIAALRYDLPGSLKKWRDHSFLSHIINIAFYLILACVS